MLLRKKGQVEKLINRFEATKREPRKAGQKRKDAKTTAEQFNSSMQSIKNEAESLIERFSDERSSQLEHVRRGRENFNNWWTSNQGALSLTSLEEANVFMAWKWTDTIVVGLFFAEAIYSFSTTMDYLGDNSYSSYIWAGVVASMLFLGSIFFKWLMKKAPRYVHYLVHVCAVASFIFFIYNVVGIRSESSVAEYLANGETIDDSATVWQSLSIILSLLFVGTSLSILTRDPHIVNEAEKIIQVGTHQERSLIIYNLHDQTLKTLKSIVSYINKHSEIEHKILALNEFQLGFQKAKIDPLDRNVMIAQVEKLKKSFTDSEPKIPPVIPTSETERTWQ